MKIACILAAAITAIARAEAHELRGHYPQPGDGEKRFLHHLEDNPNPNTVVFEECVGIHITECQTLIQNVVNDHPELFDGNSALDYEVADVRTKASEEYHKVGLRTNKPETKVAGILGDGMVFYPFQWCTTAGCYSIGPWDCDIGGLLAAEACCNLIKENVPEADVNGNSIDCFADPPIGSASKPVNKRRVLIHVDANEVVVHPPRNE